ncbi:MAG: serine hydrolase [Brevinematales bacterium]
MKTAALIFLLTIIAGLISAQSNSGYFPGDTWRTSTPEAQGMDSGLLAGMLDKIHKDNIDIHSILIVKHGYMVLEAYKEPFGRNNIHVINSCTKNIASALIGIALKEGYIKSIGQKVLDIFPDWKVKNPDDNKRSMTVKDLLTESSGIEMEGDVPDGYYNKPDWNQYYLDQPMASPHGKIFHYDSAGVNLLMAILHKTSGMKISDFADKFLFRPIGITNYSWETDNKGLNTGGRGLAMTSVEMARFGFLYLNKGIWSGKQVLPAGWVKASMSDQIKPPAWFSKNRGYGYLWWELQSGGFAGIGAGGQYIIVMPETDMVIVITSGLDNKIHWQTVSPLLEEYLFRSAVSGGAALPENPVKLAGLSAAVRNFARDPVNNLPVAVPETAQRISGKKYILDPNSWGLKSITLSFYGKDGCTADMVWPGFLFFDYRHKISIGTDGKYKENIFVPDSREREFSRIIWTGDNTFVIEYYSPWADCNKIHINTRIDQDRFSMTWRSDAGGWGYNYSGRMEQAHFLSEAASRGDYTFIRNYKGYINTKDNYGRTALMSAANADTVKALIAAGADVNAVDKDGWTALMFAVKEGRTDEIKELIAAGADVKAKDKFGRTALYWIGNKETEDLLKKAGAKGN